MIETPIRKVTVLGAGSWGTTLANHLAKNGAETTLWLRDAALTETINKTRENEEYLPGVKLSEALLVTNDLPLALKGAQVVVSSVPSHGVREIFTRAAAGKMISPETIIVNTAKGIEIETGHTMSGLFMELGFSEPVVLSGPTFAAEVARSLPCAIVAASRNERDAEAVQKLFSSDYFRVYTNKDVTGVEIGGALKNVVAIASGISDGLELGTNARAALITRGLAEITRLGMKMGSERETFFGLSGLGDLILTCTGPLSRNRTVGLEIGKGRSLEDIISSMKMVAEGVKTSKAVLGLSKKLNVEMPITEEINHVLYDGKTPKHAVTDLMRRELKEE